LDFQVLQVHSQAKSLACRFNLPQGTTIGKFAICYLVKLDTPLLIPYISILRNHLLAGLKKQEDMASQKSERTVLGEITNDNTGIWLFINQIAQLSWLCCHYI
jgi:hypothetical protein